MGSNNGQDQAARSRSELCRECGARCWHGVSIQIDPPQSPEELDTIRWYLAHRDVQVFIDAEGDWLVEFVTPCELLGEDGLCRIYEQRPAICRDYPDPEHLCEYEGNVYQRRFCTIADLEQYLLERDRRARPRRVSASPA